MMTTNLDPQPFEHMYGKRSRDDLRWVGTWLFNPRTGYSQDEADYR